MYVLGNPLRYTDPTGHFERDQVKQYLTTSGMSDEEAENLIVEWETYHAEWWEMLREAEYGDELDALHIHQGALGKVINGRIVGQFIEGQNGTFDFFFYVFDGMPMDEYASYDLWWAEGGAISSYDATRYGDPHALLMFYDKASLDSTGILLLRPRETSPYCRDYKAIKGTGVYYDSAGGINTPNPDARDMFWGWTRVFAGGLGLASGMNDIQSGDIGAGSAKGVFGGSWGVAGGFGLVVNYINEWNAQQHLVPYR
jgi:hypothetical protein